MSNTETPTPPSAGAEINRLTNPADLMPAQIAEALAELAKRDQVAIRVHSHYGNPAEFSVVEVEKETGNYLVRAASGPTYAAALAACRAAEFSDGKGGGK